MKRLLALTAVLIPLYLFAQGFGSFSHDQPFFAKDASGSAFGPCSLPLAVDPSGSNTLYSMWIQDDIAYTNKVNDTNAWVDRLNCVPLRLATSLDSIAPTNLVDRLWLPEQAPLEVP